MDAERATHAGLDSPPDRERFVLSLVGELAEVLEDNVGLAEAEGFIAMVGGRIGRDLDGVYRRKADADTLTPQQLADALVDLKRRIDGNFRIASIDGARIVLVNDRCPFGAAGRGRQALCMMTSNVFGRMVADNTGYARIRLDRTLARGDPECRIVVSFDPHDRSGSGREYFG